MFREILLVGQQEILHGGITAPAGEFRGGHGFLPPHGPGIVHQIGKIILLDPTADILAEQLRQPSPAEPVFLRQRIDPRIIERRTVQFFDDRIEQFVDPRAGPGIGMHFGGCAGRTDLRPEMVDEKGQFREMFLDFFNRQEDDLTPFRFACRTDDGSYTFYHPVFRQHFHSMAGAAMESDKKYLDPCRIRERLKQGESLKILEIGFGMGFNAAALHHAVKETGGSAELVSLESDPAVLRAAALLPEHPDPEMIAALQDQNRFTDSGFQQRLIFGDARTSLPDGIRFDAVFLDGFSPDANPELRTAEFIGELKKRLNPDGLLAALTPQNHLAPLSEKDYLITTKSTVGTPYSDPGLDSTREQILTRHVQAVSERRKQGIPKWFRK